MYFTKCPFIYLRHNYFFLRKTRKIYNINLLLMSHFFLRHFYVLRLTSYDHRRISKIIHRLYLYVSGLYEFRTDSTNILRTNEYIIQAVIIYRKPCFLLVTASSILSIFCINSFILYYGSYE